MSVISRLPKTVHIAVALMLAAAGVVCSPGTSSAATGATAEAAAATIASIASHGAAGTAYVVNEFGSTLSAIDLSTDSVTATVPTSATDGISANPAAAFTTPDGKQVYLLNTSGELPTSSVTVLDAATGAIVAEIPLRNRTSYSNLVFSPHGDRAYLLGGDAASEITIINTHTHAASLLPHAAGIADFVLSPEGGKLYALDYVSGAITVFDTATGKRLSSFSGGAKYARQLLLSPDGSTLYVRHASDATLREIATATGKTVAEVVLGPVGWRPGQFALAPDGSTLYAIGFDRDGGEAVAVDLAGGTVSAPIKISLVGTPDHLAVSADGATVYVSGRNVGKVYVIDSASRTVKATIQDWSDAGLTFSPDGTRAYLPDHNAVDVIDTATSAVIGKLATGLGPTSVAFADRGARAFVVNGMSDDVSVVDTSSESILRTIPGGAADPYGEALTPDGRTAYLMSVGDSVVAVDLKSHKITAVIPVGGEQRWIAISPNGADVYVSKATDKVAVIDTRSNKVTAEISVGSYPGQVVFSPDGSRAYAPVLATGSIAVIDTATRTVLKTVHVSGFVYSLTLSPNGSFAYANVGTLDMPVLDTATDTVSGTVSLPAGAKPDGMAFSPDGSRAYITDDGTNMLYVVDTGTNAVTASIPIPAAFQVTVSPDGAKAYVLGAESGTFSIVDTATETVAETTKLGPGLVPSVELSPDGATAYVLQSATSTRSTGSVFVIDTATGAVTHTITVGDYAVQIALATGGAGPAVRP